MERKYLDKLMLAELALERVQGELEWLRAKWFKDAASWADARHRLAGKILELSQCKKHECDLMSFCAECLIEEINEEGK